ncbi:MAG: acyl-CoA thioesterase, partial [Pseudomonadales bacterium]
RAQATHQQQPLFQKYYRDHFRTIHVFSLLSLVGGWVRLSESPDVFCDGALVALIDAWPPAILPMLEQVVPSSSITWNIEFLHPRKQLGADDYIYYECEAVQAVAGYAHSEAKIYDQEGRLIALSRQLVGVYEKKK